VPDDAARPHLGAVLHDQAVGRGTGLGLDIAAPRRREQHGGQLDLDTRPGRTVFAVRLPAPRPGGA
jgi:signal transduction histidine kinase